MITMIQEKIFYGRNINISIDGGIILIKNSKTILVVLYPFFFIYIWNRIYFY